MLPDFPDRLARYAGRRGLPLPQPPYDAAALGLREQDLLVLAGLPVPEALAPLDHRAGNLLAHLALHFLAMGSVERSELLARLRSLPQQERGGPPLARHPEEAGPGALLLGLLRNRNLAYVSAAKFLHLQGGPYLSGATIPGFARGRAELTTETLNGLAAVVGLPRDDLAVLVGLRIPAEPAPAPHPARLDVAELLWEGRRLSQGQIEEEYQRLKRSRA